MKEPKERSTLRIERVEKGLVRDVMNPETQTKRIASQLEMLSAGKRRQRNASALLKRPRKQRIVSDCPLHRHEVKLQQVDDLVRHDDSVLGLDRMLYANLRNRRGM